MVVNNALSKNNKNSCLSYAEKKQPWISMVLDFLYIFREINNNKNTKNHR